MLGLNSLLLLFTTEWINTLQRTTLLFAFVWIIGASLTGPCPEGLVSYGRSAPVPGRGDCAPIWSWPRYSPGFEPSEAQAKPFISDSSFKREFTKPSKKMHTGLWMLDCFFLCHTTLPAVMWEAIRCALSVWLLRYGGLSCGVPNSTRHISGPLCLCSSTPGLKTKTKKHRKILRRSNDSASDLIAVTTQEFGILVQIKATTISVFYNVMLELLKGFALAPLWRMVPELFGKHDNSHTPFVKVLDVWKAFIEVKNSINFDLILFQKHQKVRPAY